MARNSTRIRDVGEPISLIAEIADQGLVMVSRDFQVRGDRYYRLIPPKDESPGKGIIIAGDKVLGRYLSNGFSGKEAKVVEVEFN